MNQSDLTMKITIQVLKITWSSLSRAFPWLIAPSNIHLRYSPQSHEVLHHFFSKVMVNSVQLFFCKQASQMIGQLSWRCRVSSKGFFDNNSRPITAWCHATSLQIWGDRFKNWRRQSKIENSVDFLPTHFYYFLVQQLEITPGVIGALDVMIHSPKLLQSFSFVRFAFNVWIALLANFTHGQIGSCISNEDSIFGKQSVSK